MTKQEIIAEINAKIAGQGTNIDAGSALPGILQGIIDLIPEAPTPQVQADLTVTDPDSPAYVKLAEIKDIPLNEVYPIDVELYDEISSAQIIRCNGDIMARQYVSNTFLDDLGDRFFGVGAHADSLFVRYINYDYADPNYTNIDGTFLVCCYDDVQGRMLVRLVDS